MKLLVFISILSFFITGQEGQLKGKYKMEYEEEYSSQNCIVVFTNNTYERKLSNGKIVKGKIEYQKFNIALKDNKNNLEMDFLKSDILKDTIYFGTKNLKDTLTDDMEFTIYTGKLIKLNN